MSSVNRSKTASPGRLRSPSGQRESPPTSSNPLYQRKISNIVDTMLSDFDPYIDEPEIVELGLSHEIVNDELYLPSHPSRDWIHCYISTTGPGCFRMYLEGKKRVRFLLSAKQFSPTSAFYISSSEDFPVLDNIPRSGYLARVEKQRDDSFLLCLNQCHLCDVHLGFFHCGRGKTEREVIARVHHSYRSFKPHNVEYRCMNVMIPSISKSGKRKIWCPRAFQRAKSPNLSNDIDVNTALSLFRDVSFRFENQKPEWNERAKSLVVKFQGNRVLIPSTRNFLLCTSWDTSILSANMVEEDDDDEDEELFEDDEASHSVTSRSVHENEIVPMTRSHDDNDDSRSSSSRSHKSSSTVMTQPMNTVSSFPPPASHALGHSPPSSCRPPSLTRSQTMPYPHSVASSAGITSGSVTKAAASSVFGPYHSHRQRSESSIDSESTITATSATPTMTSKHSNKSIQIGSPKPRTPSNSGRKRIFPRTESKVLDDNEPVMQFGKSTQTRYSLDFKFPLSPLQAFGIALSAFAFESLNQMKQAEKQQQQKQHQTTHLHGRHQSPLSRR